MVQSAACVAGPVLYDPPALRLLRVYESAGEYAAPESSPAPGQASVPDPFEDADALEELEEEIVVLSAHLHAGEHRLLVLVAEFDRRRGWELGGHRT